MSPTKIAAIPLIVMTVLASASGEARAQCGMGEVDWYTTEHMAVSRADDMLQHGKPREAAVELQHMWPRLHEAVPVTGSVAVILDGVRLMAVAAVRADGNLPAGPGWSSATTRQRADNVAWGVSRLRMIAAVSRNDFRVTSDLAEALTRSPGTRQEGRAMLETLDEKHGVASAEAYAALAAARVDAGNTAGAELATWKCLEIAGDAPTQCAVATGSSNPTVTAAR